MFHLGVVEEGARAGWKGLGVQSWVQSSAVPGTVCSETGSFTLQAPVSPPVRRVFGMWSFSDRAWAKEMFNRWLSSGGREEGLETTLTKFVAPPRVIQHGPGEASASPGLDFLSHGAQPTTENNVWQGFEECWLTVASTTGQALSKLLTSPQQ